MSALGARIERKGIALEMGARLEELRAGVLAGRSLINLVADGTLWGWELRLALQHQLGAPLADWDRHRTQGERLALVDATLSAVVGEPKRTGGWRVSR